MAYRAKTTTNIQDLINEGLPLRFYSPDLFDTETGAYPKSPIPGSVAYPLEGGKIPFFWKKELVDPVIYPTAVITWLDGKQPFTATQSDAQSLILSKTFNPKVDSIASLTTPVNSSITHANGWVPPTGPPLLWFLGCSAHIKVLFPEFDTQGKTVYIVFDALCNVVSRPIKSVLFKLFDRSGSELSYFDPSSIGIGPTTFWLDDAHSGASIAKRLVAIPILAGSTLGGVEAVVQLLDICNINEVSEFNGLLTLNLYSICVA